MTPARGNAKGLRVSVSIGQMLIWADYGSIPVSSLINKPYKISAPAFIFVGELRLYLFNDPSTHSAIQTCIVCILVESGGRGGEGREHNARIQASKCLYTASWNGV